MAKGANVDFWTLNLKAPMTVARRVQRRQQQHQSLANHNACWTTPMIGKGPQRPSTLLASE